MNIVIIEDELPALNRLKKLVMAVEPEAHILATADSIESAAEIFTTHRQIDLALMDIELADGRSFDIFKRVDVNCPVIFTTAYDEFALQAFKVNSIDYLLKPVDADLLKDAIEKFKRQRNQQFLSRDLSHMLMQLQQQSPVSYKSRFLVKVGVKWISQPVEAISYFFAADKSVYMVTKSNQKYIMDESLDQLSTLLDPKLFYHASRQFILSYTSIQSVNSYFNGKLKVEVHPPATEEVTVSREKAADFKKWLDR